MKIHNYFRGGIFLLALLLLAGLGCETQPPEAEAPNGQTQTNGDADMNGEQPPVDGQTQPGGDAPMNGEPNTAGQPQMNGERQTNGEAGAGGDLQHAQALWSQIKDYESWAQPEGFEGWQKGTEPHGVVLRYYINDAARQDVTQDGAVIVKENFSEQSEDALMAITVMEKREGYDPETKNWFYVKYSPEGEVMKSPEGMDLAGLVGKGQAQGCIPCHATAGGDDYLFHND